VVNQNWRQHTIQLEFSKALRTQPSIDAVTSVALGLPISPVDKTTDSNSSGEALYACDAGTGALYRVDVGISGEEVAPATIILKDETLKGGCLVAVSDAGLIAVAGTGSNLYLTRPSREHWDVKKQAIDGLETPTQLAFAGETLLVLMHERLFSLDLVNDTEKLGRLQLTPVDRAVPGNAPIRRLATDRGIVYSLTPDAAFVFSYADPESAGVPFPYVSDYAASQSKAEILRGNVQSRHLIGKANEFTVSGENLLLLDSKGGQVSELSRLVPVAINLEGPSTQIASALNAIYRYLFSAGLLRTQTVVAERDYDSLRQWLLELQVLLPLGRRTNDNKKSVDLMQEDLSRLICTLNLNRCSAANILSLNSPVPAGRAMTFPQVHKRSHTVVRFRDLDGSTLDDVVAETSPSGSYSSWYLADLNEDNLPTFEATLNRARFLMFTPFNEHLQLGSIVRNVGGEEQLITESQNCFSQARSKSHPTLPSVVAANGGIKILPRALKVNASSEFRYLDDVSIEFKFENPVIEQVDTDRLGEQDAVCLTRNLHTDSTQPVFVITTILKAAGMRYRLLNKKREVIHPTVSQLRQWGLAGIPDRTKEWSVRIDKTYAIAYQAKSPLLDAMPMRWQDLTDPSILKQGSAQDIRSQNEGRFLIPVDNWQLDVLLPQRDLQHGASALSKITAGNPGVYILPRSGLMAAAQSSGTFNPVTGGPTIDTVKQNRATLLSNIHWPIGGSAMQALTQKRVTIAVAESDSSTNSWRWRPQFMEDDGVTNLWRESVKDLGLIPITQPVNLKTPKYDSYSVVLGQIRDDDHGAYISGLLAGRNKEVPGLLPNVGLMLVNMAQISSKGLDSIIEDANTNNVYIVNFSQILKVTESDTALAGLKRKMKKEWERILFVAAASNNEGKDSGEDLEYVIGEMPLIKWARDLPQNIIGVAASDPSDDHIIKKCKPDPQVESQTACSNFGSKFVQLTAPGYRVYGLGADNVYLLGSGTSVAAPQVAAAAALLKATGTGLTPAKIKARLIYTADYNEDYIEDESVWGGRLNVQQAITEPTEYVIRTNTARNSKLFRVEIDLDWILEGLNTGNLYDPEIERGVPPNAIRANQILRMHYTQNGFWVVYVEKERPYRMKMIVHANPSERKTIPCTRMWEWDEQKQEFHEVKAHNWLIHGIPLVDILDFIGPVPESVRLPG
jgi:hypothetical protein